MIFKFPHQETSSGQGPGDLTGPGEHGKEFEGRSRRDAVVGGLGQEKEV